MTSPALSHLVWYGLSPAPQATNEVVGRVPKATQEEMLAAVDSCSRAFHSWSETSILSRQQVFLRYQQLIKDNIVGKCPHALMRFLSSFIFHQYASIFRLHPREQGNSCVYRFAFFAFFFADILN